MKFAEFLLNGNWDTVLMFTAKHMELPTLPSELPKWKWSSTVFQKNILFIKFTVISFSAKTR